MKKLLIGGIILLFLFDMFRAKAVASGKQESCSRTSFQIAVKQPVSLKDKPSTGASAVAIIPDKTILNVMERIGSWYKVCRSNSVAYTEMKTAREIYSANEAMVFAKFKNRPKTGQVMTAIGKTASGTTAKVNTYVKLYGEWRRSLNQMDAVLGYNGFSSAKREGDGATPAGIYKLGTVFGTGVKPPGVKMYYKRAGKYDYWVDDPASPDYNKWVTYSGDPKRKWRSFERMNQPLYKYGMVIEYNRNPIIKNKGSAIFLHTWKGPASKTAGCVALSETNLITLLKWFDPKQQPAIVMGTYSQLKTIQ